MNQTNDLVHRMHGTLRFNVIAPGSSPHEYMVAERQFREAMERIEELEAKIGMIAESGNNTEG